MFECIQVLTRDQLNLHSATAQQSPQGSSMKGMCAVVEIGRTAVLYIYSVKNGSPPVFSYISSGASANIMA